MKQKHQPRSYRLKIYVGKNPIPKNLLFERDFEDVQQSYAWLHKLLAQRQLVAPFYYLEFWYQKKKLIIHWVIDSEMARKKRSRKL